MNELRTTPWEVSDVRTIDGHLMVTGGEGSAWGLVAEVIEDDDARLIAAAPELLEAVRKASQLASIASDWNLYEVEIDGEMVGIYALKAAFDAAISKASVQS